MHKRVEWLAPQGIQTSTTTSPIDRNCPDSRSRGGAQPLSHAGTLSANQSRFESQENDRQME